MKPSGVKWPLMPPPGRPAHKEINHGKRKSGLEHVAAHPRLGFCRHPAGVGRDPNAAKRDEAVPVAASTSQMRTAWPQGRAVFFFVLASEAKQSSRRSQSRDCFVAKLLAMTELRHLLLQMREHGME